MRPEGPAQTLGIAQIAETRLEARTTGWIATAGELEAEALV